MIPYSRAICQNLRPCFLNKSAVTAKIVIACLYNLHWSDLPKKEIEFSQNRCESGEADIVSQQVAMDSVVHGTREIKLEKEEPAPSLE